MDSPFEYASVEATGFLLTELALGAVLLAGMFLVRRGHVRAHKYLQSSVVLGNLPIVLLWMLPHYLGRVLPDLPGELDGPYYLFPSMMLVLGGAAEILGVYILLVAGTDWLPERWRFRNYKRWMRTELVLWWSVLSLGAATFLVWYSGS